MSKDTCDFAIDRIKRVSVALLVLQSENQITVSTYNYLNDMLIFVLQDILYAHKDGELLPYEIESEEK